MAEQHDAGANGAHPQDDAAQPTRRGSGGNAARRSPGWSAVREVLIVMALAVVIAFVVKTFLVRGYYIPSGSMEQTLELDDRIFVNVIGAKTGHIDRGDIVVFDDTQGWLPEAPRPAPGPSARASNSSVCCRTAASRPWSSA